VYRAVLLQLFLFSSIFCNLLLKNARANTGARRNCPSRVPVASENTSGNTTSARHEYLLQVRPRVGTQVPITSTCRNFPSQVPVAIAHREYPLQVPFASDNARDNESTDVSPNISDPEDGYFCNCYLVETNYSD